MARGIEELIVDVIFVEAEQRVTIVTLFGQFFDSGSYRESPEFYNIGR